MPYAYVERAVYKKNEAEERRFGVPKLYSEEKEQ